MDGTSKFSIVWLLLIFVTKQIGLNTKDRLSRDAVHNI